MLRLCMDAILSRIFLLVLIFPLRDKELQPEKGNLSLNHDARQWLIKWQSLL